MSISQSKLSSAKLLSILFDAESLIGFAVVSYGFWLAWHPLGFIIGGLALSAQGVLLGRSIASQRRPS